MQFFHFILITNQSYQESKHNHIKGVFMPNQSSQFLTQREVAQLLNVDIRTIRKWTRVGKLNAYRYGHRVFYKRQELTKV